MKTNRIVFAGLVSAFVAGGVFAEEYTLVSGFTDWNRTESYKTSSGVVAQKLPGREDTVLIPQEIASVTIDDNSIATVGAFKYLYPRRVPEMNEWLKNINDPNADITPDYYYKGYYQLIKEDYGYFFSVVEPYTD